LYADVKLSTANNACAYVVSLCKSWIKRTNKVINYCMFVLEKHPLKWIMIVVKLKQTVCLQFFDAVGWAAGRPSGL